MASLLWTHALVAGHPEMDSQHRQLVALANALNEAMLQRADDEVLRKQFAGLVSYAAMHFTSEERLMAQSAYPAALEHRKEHERLLLDLYRMRGDHAPGVRQVVQALALLHDWLREHIETSDRQLAAFLAQRPVT